MPRSAATGPSVAAGVTVPRYIDEDLSCLDTGGRLLSLAEDESRSWVERVADLAGSAAALDAFFAFRGVRLRQAAARGPQPGRAVRVLAGQLAERQARVHSRLGALGPAGAAWSICDWDMLTAAEKQGLSEVFGERLAPALAPLVTAPGQPLPGPAGLSLNVAVALVDAGGDRRLGTVELPPVLERFVAVPAAGPAAGAASPGGRLRLVPLEQIVGAHLPELFPGLAVTGSGLFRLTRHGGVSLAPGAEDLLAATDVAARDHRGGVPVRLEVERRAPSRTPSPAEDLTGRLADQFDLGPSDVYAVGGLLGLADLARAGLPPERTGTPIVHWTVVESETADPFTVVDAGDVVVLPDHGGACTVEAFLVKAARDPRVVAIKQTLFRPDPAGPVVRALVRAAERGTHVVALVELAARLAERDSVACARALEKAGVHVVYGLDGLRTHCSASLVVAQADGGEVRRYGLLSTGPHQSHTTPGSLGLISGHPGLAADLADLFNFLTGYSRPSGYRRLLVAPAGLRAGLMGMIRREASAGAAGRIRLQMGRLADREIIDGLYAASAAGTDVEILVSGACALRPGVRGLSERITVRGMAVSAPATSRCFGFGREGAGIWYLASADLATRNLDRQVDVAVPVDDPCCAQQLEDWFGVAAGAAPWVLGPDGSWTRAREKAAPGPLSAVDSSEAGAARPLTSIR